MNALRRHGPHPGPVRGADPITHAVMLAVDASGLGQPWVSKRAGIAPQQLHAWRSGQSAANARSLSYILEAIGAEVVIRDKGARPDAPIRLLSLNAIRRAVGRG